MTVTNVTFTEQLPFVLRSLAQSNKTGLLIIEQAQNRNAQKGEIFFDHGDAIFVRTEYTWGVPALQQILSWKGTYYSFHEGMKISRPQQRLLPSPGQQHTPPVTPGPQHSIRAILKAEENQPSAPSSHLSQALFRTRVGATQPVIMQRMDRRDRMVMVLFNGRRTLQDISRLMHRSEEEVQKTAEFLLRQGYIVRVDIETTGESLTANRGKQ